MSLMKSFLEFKNYFTRSNKLFFAIDRSLDPIENYFEHKVDSLFVYFLFIAQFIHYIILFLIPSTISASLLMNAVAITILSFILLLFIEYRKFFPYAIYFVSFIINGLIFLSVATMTLHFSNRITLAEINNLYISLSILLLIHAYRLRKFSCVIPAFQFIIFHLLSLYSFYVTLHWTFDGSLLLPDFFYLVSMFLGTGIIINRRENIKEIHSLNKEKFVIHRELELAKKVQDSLFPKDIKINGLKYQVFRQSHNFIGGDFYDFVMLREGNTGIFITDIAGHGISSAMVATIMKVIVATIPYQFKLLPEKFLTHLDKRLSVDLDHYHASAIYMFMNFQTKKIFLGNAGHPYPIYCDKGGEFVELNTEGSILGFQITDPIVTELEIHFNEGDRFVLYTDGLVESPTESGKFVSEKDLINILNLHKEIKDLKTFKTKVLDDLTNKFGLKKFTDDTMVLFFEITKRNLI